MKSFKESALKVRQQDIKPMTKIMANQYVEKGNFKKVMDLLKHMGKKVKLEVPKEKSSSVVWTVEGKMNEATTVSRNDFDKMKKGSKIEITYGSSISSSTTRTFQVKSKTRSAKYNVDKVNMVDPSRPGGMKFHLYSRGGKDATLALGDMAATIKSYKILGESVEEKRDAGKSATGYDIYHKTYSGAMQHAYAHAKKKHGVTVSSDDIDSKVASGPSKPSNGKTVSHILGTDKKKNLHVQVYNTGKSYELNMYVESVELDEEIDFRKAFMDIKSYAKKNGGMDKTDFEKVAYYVKAIGDNQNTPNVANKAFMAMKKHIAGLDTDVRDGIHVLLKKHGMVKNGRMVQEGKWFVRQSAKPNKTGTYQGKKFDDGKKAIAQARKDWKMTPDEHMSAKMMKEESVDLSENYRTLARAGMGTESKGEARVGLELDYYDGSGTKRMGKITKVTPKGYMVKDDKDGKVRQYAFHDRAKAKEILARIGKGKYNESKELDEASILRTKTTRQQSAASKEKDRKKAVKTYQDIRKGKIQGVKMANEDDDPCWDSHKQIGMKKKGGKMVPNCVPK